MFSRLREPVSSLTHLAGAGAALVGLLALLLAGEQTPARAAALAVYGASLFLLFFASGVYHAVQASPRVTRVLRKLDHAAIYLLIAGTYTPFCVLAFSGFRRWGLLAVIWGLAALGIGLKVRVIDTPRWVTAGVYVVMGWLSVFAAPQMAAALPGQAIAWLAAGGVIYTLGALVYISKRLDFFPGRFGFHEVWHIFVLLGAGAHFAAVSSIV